MPDLEDSEDLAFKIAQIETEARKAREEREILNEEVQKLIVYLFLHNHLCNAPFPLSGQLL